MAKTIVKKIIGGGRNIFDDINNFNDDWKSAEPDTSFNEFDELVQKIIKGYEAANEPKFQKKTSFAPSTLVFGHGVCPRYWYLAFEGNTFQNSNTGKEIANMDSGTDRHERIQKAMEDAEVLTASEVWTEHDDPPIRGKVDCFINWKDEEYIGEIKTKDQTGFEYYLKTRKPSSYHVLQLLIYMKIYKKNNGLVIYENKNSHDIIILPVKVNKDHVDFIDYLFNWMKEVHSAWKDRKLPEIPFRGGKQIKICDSCPLKDACSSAAVGDIKIARRKDEKGLF
jgi:CRISPR/Cas system-associated exonuclease Cas4 (RecB family)